MKPNDEQNQGWGGKRPGSGRKTDRKVNFSRPFYLFADQVESVTPEFVRASIDNTLNQIKGANRQRLMSALIEMGLTEIAAERFIDQNEKK